MVWVVSGARRHVGKTWLCLRLQQLLPAAAYVKLGHAPRQPNKPGTYLTSLRDVRLLLQERNRPGCHVVIESNLLARQQEGDLRIYIEAPPGATDVRDDATLLRDAAHIVVGPGVDPGQWIRLLEPVLEQRETALQVCAALAELRDYLARPCSAP